MITDFKTVRMITLGCKVNQYESEAIAELFTNAGYRVFTQEEAAADVVVVNTCTVTNLGDKKSRQAIRRSKQLNKDAVVVVCGCYAQVSPEDISKIDEVDIILGTKDRANIVAMVDRVFHDKAIPVTDDSCRRYKINAVTDISKEDEFENLSVAGMTGRTRAYVKIQDGCRQFCSYCIIPYARGPVRSRSLASIRHEVQNLADNGFKEIVLTGIHVASYGVDWQDAQDDKKSGSNLTDVIKLVHGINGILRVRLSSLEPSFITNEFLDEVSELDGFCDHFHLSLQSGCDKILKKMNRKYTTQEYLSKVNLIRQYFPYAALWTDVIAGFPGETDENFKETYSFLQESGLSKLHVFPYSKKNGTPAACFTEQADNKTKTQRTNALLKLSSTMYDAFLKSQLNRKVNVLFEKEYVQNRYEGHTTNYIRVTAQDFITLPTLLNQQRGLLLKEVENDGIKGVILP